jgi:putative component of membrane protein insertase Oxa1/YidC/SpoIIIJ protein YidD
MLRTLILSLILFYQRRLSPHKGFTCAYSDLTGRASCSHIGFRAVRRFGALSGLAMAQRRTALCGIAYRRYAPVTARHLRSQRGDCDPGCDLPCDCEAPSGKGLSRFCSCAQYCDCGGCDWGSRDRSRKRKRAREDEVYIPPRRTPPGAHLSTSKPGT